jgi:hypothetical protein
MRASRCCGRPVLQFHGAGSTIARAQPPPKHMHCRHYRPTTVPNTSQNGRPTHQSGPNSSTLSLQGVVFKVEGTKVTLCHRRQSSPYRNFPELSLSSTSVLNCTWQYFPTKDPQFNKKQRSPDRRAKATNPGPEHDYAAICWRWAPYFFFSYIRLMASSSFHWLA